MSDLKKIIEDSFTQYAGAVLQSRALVDARDCLKPSARQIFYSMKLHKFVHDKPFQKTPNAYGAALADFYIHGDTSAVAIMMRASQKFSMRYPLTEVKGFKEWIENNNVNYKTFYDTNFKDVYFVSDNECLVYNSLLDQFISFMDYCIKLDST